MTQINVTAISSSSILNLGDTHQVQPKMKGIAVQKEGETFQGDLKFENFPIFQRKANWPDYQPTSNVQKITFHHNPTIHVKQVYLLALSTSSIFQVGNINHISSEARIKHFRIILEEDEDEDEG